MKNLVVITFCFLHVVSFGQTDRKTSFRLLIGGNYTAKTNLRNEIYLGWPTTEYHEEGNFGLSFQALSSFYLSKRWRFNTGLLMDRKGYFIRGITAPADSPNPYSYSVTANYFGIPLEIERTFLKTKHWALSVDVGLAKQWKISGEEKGLYFVSNQFTVLAGINLTVPYGGIAFIVHPIFRYSPTQLENPLIGGTSPSVNAYSVGLELGVSF